MKNVLMLGVRAGFRHKTAAVWSYIATATASLPFALAIGWLVAEPLGHSLSADAFARGLDPVLAFELFRSEKAGLLALIPALGGALVLWTLISTYAHGAVLSVVSRTEASRTGDFFSAGGRVFGRLLRLTLLGMPFVVLVTALSIWALAKVSGVLIEDWISEKGVLAARLLATGVGALIFLWASGAYDLMRVEAVARGEHRARYAFVRGLARAARHPLAVLIVEVPFSAGALALTLVVSLLDTHLERASWLAIAVGLVLEQCVVFARALVKVSLAGAEVAYVMLSGR